MSTNPVELLKSSNPEQRKQGIRIVAGMRSEKALRVLMKVYQQDPDEDVREMAKRGATFIAQKLRESEAEEPDDAASYQEDDDYDDEQDFEPVEVSDRNQARARGYVDEALSHQLNEDRAKAIRALTKALEVNPNLRQDNYFGSAAASVMGMDTDEAIQSLRSDTKRRQLIDEEKQGKLDAATANHMETALKHTWGTLMIDIALFSVIILFGGLLSVLVIDYTANSRANQINNQLVATVNEDGETVPPRLTEREEIAQAEAQLSVMNSLRDALSPLVGFVVGFGLWISTLLALIVFGLILQPVATRIFNGSGTTPYAIYNLLIAYNVPLIVTFLVIILAAALIFLVGLPLLVGTWITLGIVSLIQLVILFRIVGAIGKTYNLGVGPALVAGLVVSIPVNIVLSIISGVLFPALVMTFDGLIEAVGAL